MENYIKDAKEMHEFIDLNTDIYNGITLINNRRFIPMYVDVGFGRIQINENFIKNENDIVKYVNDIKDKYGKYMNMVDFFHPDIQWNLIGNCVELLQKIQYSKIIGKSIEEITKRKEN